MRFYDACWLATWPGRERTSSAVLERSAATWLGIQLDSSLLVLVAEVSPLLALRPRPIVSVLLCVCSLRARGGRDGERQEFDPTRVQCAMGKGRAVSALPRHSRSPSRSRQKSACYFTLTVAAVCCRRGEKERTRQKTSAH